MTTIVSFSDLSIMLSLTKDESEYPVIPLLSDEVHDALEDHAGRNLGVIEKKTETGFVDNEDFINLKNIPIKSVTSVVVDGVTITDYSIGEYGITFTTKVTGAYTIITKGGFKTIPANIYRAELSQIVYEYQNLNNLAAKSFTNDGGGVTIPGFVLLDQVIKLIQEYRHIDKLGY